MVLIKRLGLLILFLVASSFASAAKISLVTGDYVPLTGPSLKNQGPITELVTAIFTAAGYDVGPVTMLPWARGQLLTKQARYHATFPYSKNAEREQDFLYSDVILHSDIFFFVRTEDASHDLGPTWKNKILCRPVGYVMDNIQPLLDRYQISLERPYDISACFKLLMNHRVDVVPIQDIVGWNEVRQLPAPHPDVAVLHSTLNTTEGDLYLIAPRKSASSPLLIKRFNQTLQLFRQSGRYKMLLKDLFMHSVP
nr:transporter substrate-binding domain-containing protein [Leeia oryzae]